MVPKRGVQGVRIIRQKSERQSEIGHKFLEMPQVRRRRHAGQYQDAVGSTGRFNREFLDDGPDRIVEPITCVPR